MNDTLTPPVTALLAEFASRGAVPPDSLGRAILTIRALTSSGDEAHSDNGGDDARAARLVINSLIGSTAGSGPDNRSFGQWAAWLNGLGSVAEQSADSTRPVDRIVLAALSAVDAPGDANAVAEALAIGAEIATRLLAAFSPGGDSAWDVTVIAATLGATAAVGRLLRFSEAELVNAFGIAGAQAAGPVVLTASTTASLLHARAAFLAVEACRLSRAGFLASEKIIEGKGGVGEVLFDAPDYAAMTAELGTVWS